MSSDPRRTSAWPTGPATARASSTITSASGRRARMPSRSTRAGRSCPSPMSALKTRTRTPRAGAPPSCGLACAHMSAIVLVTGGAGFIGSHVVDRMAAAGHRVRILDTRPSPWHAPGAVDTVIGDILRPDDVQRAVRGCAAVCHLAAAADVSEVHAHPAWATELNGTGTLNVLEAARQAGIARVVYASTVWVYSDVEADRVDEDTLLPNPAHLYTAGKLAGELYCRAYASLYGLEPTVLRFGIPYGPRARPAAVLPRFVERALRGEPLMIAGTGDQERAFVYVEDLAEGVVRALAPQAAGRTYNLVGRETTTIRQLAEIVREEVAPTPIVHTDGRAGDFRGAHVSGERAEQELGWRATTSLREGVRRYAAWSAEDAAAASPAPAPPRRPPSAARRRGDWFARPARARGGRPGVRRGGGDDRRDVCGRVGDPRLA